MAEKTIAGLVDDVHQAAEAMGIDVSVKDVGYMISLFLQGLADVEPRIPKIEVWLHMVADACDQVRDD